MLDNPIIDVALGLSLIYCVYSLFTTIINEIIVSILRLRAQVLKQAIKRMLTDNGKTPEGNLFDKFYKHPLIKYMSSGALSYKPSYISSENFAKTLVDLLKGLDTPANDTAINKIKEKLEELGKEKNPEKPGKEKNINEPENKKEDDNWNSETMQLINSFIIDADYKIDLFKQKLEKWFNDTMDRASGWYKRKIQMITLLIGFLIALGFNVNTIEIAKHLSKNKTARDQLVFISENYVRSRQISLDTSNTLTRLDSLVARADSLYEKDIASVNTILGLGWGTWGNFFDGFGDSILGCFITALAISLGAPFWFDLLNRLVKIRGTGTKPPEDNEKIKEKKNVKEKEKEKPPDA